MNSSHSIPAADYPYLRQCLAPQFADAAAEDIESYMYGRFGEGAASHYDEYLEGFFSDLARTFQKVAPVVANVAGGVARGAMSGSSLGLPGIIGGAVMGGAGTALGSYAKGPLRDVGNVLNTGTQIAGQFSPMGRMGNQLGSALSGLGQGRITPQRLLQQGSQLLTSTVPGMGGGVGRAMGGLMGGTSGWGGGGGPMAALAGLLGSGGGGAAGQLASLLGRPEVQQALMALSMGPVGRSTVPVGHTQMPVPTAAIAGLLQNLSAQAVSEAAAFSDGAESELSYMADADGEFVGDPAEEDDRVARLWDLLNHAQLERLTAHAHQAVQVAHQAQAVHAARQARAAPDWRFLLTEDMLQGLGELDIEFAGAADVEYAEYTEDGEADAESWTPETHHAWR